MNKDCTKDHSDIQHIMKELPVSQKGLERHKCAACAYELGYKHGLSRKKVLDIETVLEGLDFSQAKQQRHKSAHAGYMKGYYDGLNDSYK